MKSFIKNLVNFFLRKSSAHAEKLSKRSDALRSTINSTVSFAGPSPSLNELQQTFCRLTAELIIWSFRKEYKLVFAEAYRPPETARLYEVEGRGIRNSLHTYSLAIDFRLFIGTEYQKESETYKPLGDYWKSLSTPNFECCWGGDFTKPDGGHFSISYKGIK